MTYPSLALAEGPPNFANFWTSMNAHEQTFYLEGYSQGVLYGIFEMAVIYNNEEDREKTEKERQLIKKIYLRDNSIDMKVLSKVITDLYSDPANSYIETNEMIFLAKDKLQGQPIDEKLIRARKYAHDTHKFRQNLMKDKR